jgi:AraC-like DNA-binding protein
MKPGRACRHYSRKLVMPVGMHAGSLVRPEWVLEIALAMEAFVRSLEGAGVDASRLERFFRSLPPPERDLERWILHGLRDRLAFWRGSGRRSPAEHARQLLFDDYREPWTLAALARAVGCNRTTLQTEFQRLTETTVHQFLVRRRVAVAVRLLEDSDLKVSRVSREVGYRSHSAFVRHFKRITGVTLGAYRGSRGAG